MVPQGTRFFMEIYWYVWKSFFATILQRANSLSLAIATQTDSSVAVVLVFLYKRKILRLKPQYDDIFSVILSEVKNLCWVKTQPTVYTLPKIRSLGFSGGRFSWLHFQTLSLSFRRKSPAYEFRSLCSTPLYRKSAQYDTKYPSSFWGIYPEESSTITS